MSIRIASIAVACAAAAIAAAYLLRSQPTMSDATIPKFDSANSIPPSASSLETATFGGGCFWCVEAVFQRLEGVKSVVSGYSGGKAENPTYNQVCSGRTGHAEVIQIEFEPSKIAFADLLQVFWQAHDPTQLNRQGFDTGNQYRSVVYYHSPEQKETTELYIRQLDAAGTFASPIVTEVSPFDRFYPAEAYHQDYYNSNRGDGYCSSVIGPKVKKFEKAFADRMKK